ncbi:hypothetical protein M5K25_007241 [Dendrobium thyrsiflorum]|uniref:Uncharacterized protein n=1 Tax=Dendrobium thyrsiflorum TaxID=117978 RepID=A0ABD0VKQ2_DENTH
MATIPSEISTRDPPVRDLGRIPQNQPATSTCDRCLCLSSSREQPCPPSTPLATTGIPKSLFFLSQPDPRLLRPQRLDPSRRTASRAAVQSYPKTHGSASCSRLAHDPTIVHTPMSLVRVSCHRSQNFRLLKAEQSSIGTTSSITVDPLSTLRKASVSWFHVDVAYACSACICPKFRQHIDGMNAHIWFLTNFDCSLLWVKDQSALIQSLSNIPEFLENKASQANAVIDFKDWQIPLERRFRLLKLWMVLRMYGQENLQNYIQNDINLAKQFEQLVKYDSRFEVMAPQTFSLVCFRLIPLPNHQDNNYKLNYSLKDSINPSGKIFLSHTVMSGKFVLRLVVGAPLTKEKHVKVAWNLWRGLKFEDQNSSASSISRTATASSSSSSPTCRYGFLSSG